MEHSQTIIESSISDLEAIELKLIAIDEEELDNEQKNALADQINEVALALTGLRTAQIEALSAEYKTRENELSTCTSNLKLSLESIQTAIAIIGVVGQALGTITDIIALI